MLSERLKELMLENGLTIRELYSKLNIQNDTVIYSWLKGETYPNAENLVELANIFECSTDYLLGRTDDFAQVVKSAKPFSEQLKFIMQLNCVTQYRMAKDKIAKPSTFHGWFVKKNQPTVSSLLKLSEYFKVSVDFLLGRE